MLSSFRTLGRKIPAHLAVATALGGLAIAVGVSAVAKPQPPAERLPEPNLIPFPVHEKTLANGLQVVAVPMGPSGLAAHWIAVRTGSRDEYEPGRTGFAHFFEHMMFYGTDTYPQPAYESMVTGMGADTNAFTSQDITVYYLNIAAEDLDTVMTIESDRFKNLSYPEESFKTEAGAVYGEFRKSKSSPWYSLFEAMTRTAFTKHTYGHTVIGHEADIKAMPTLYDYSRTFFDRYYRPENAILVVAGDIQPEAVFAKAEKYYGDWQRGYKAPVVEVEPAQTEARRVDVAYEGRTLPMVWIGYKSEAFNPNDRTQVAASVLAELAFGETSQIYRKLVLEDQLLQRVSAQARPSRDPGLWLITATIKDPSAIEAVLTAIEAAAEQFRTTAPTAERVEAVKSNMRYSFVMSLDSPSRVASNIARMAGISGSPGVIEAFYRTLAEVTPADVRAAAQKYLVTKRRTTVVLQGKE